MAQESKREFAARVAAQLPNNKRKVTTGRVDAPIGKGPLIDRVEDTAPVTIRYSIDVTDAGPHAARVADLVLGKEWRQEYTEPVAPFGCSYPENIKDKFLAMATEVISLGAKVEISKYVQVDSLLPELKKGSPVTDDSRVRSDYTMKVNSWGRSQSRVKELVLGNGTGSKMQVSLPVELNYAEWEKDDMFKLATLLLDLDADVSISKRTGVTVPIG